MFRFVSGLVCLLAYTAVPSEYLQRGEENVCVNQRLVKVMDVFPSNWLDDWDCELHYPNVTCDRIRSGGVSIESVYFLEELLTCCPGWTRSEDDDEEDDEECELPCEEGYFGENCDFECRCINGEPGCNSIDGSCDCLDGWTGRTCDQRCSPGIYGANCTLASPFNCEHGGTNHPVTGACLCSSRYGGLACEVECPRSSSCGSIQCGQCISHSLTRCDTIIGACLCKSGWEGRYCTDLCPLGFGGDFCEEQCCSQRGRCFDDPSGINSMKCLCNDGYYGDECEDECPDGFFGRNCEQECACPSCDAVTGFCDSCPSGFKGSSCLERCSASEWGPSCISRCSCSSGEACDVFNGKCSNTNTTGLLVGLLAVVLISVLFVGFLCYRHRRKKTEGEQRNDEISPGLSQQYACTTRDRAITPQFGSSDRGHYNGTAAKYQGNPARARAHNPLYGIEKIEGSQYPTGQPAWENIEPHVYDNRPERPPHPTVEPPEVEDHEYDYLGQDHAKRDDSEVYHVPDL